MVSQCRYAAESAIEDFAVCALHDHAAVRAILDALELPCAYLAGDPAMPIVLPCGPLEEQHLEPRFSDGIISAIDCPWLGAMPAGPNKYANPKYDLFR